MSTRIMSECWPLAMSPTQKSVLISLADQANDQGVCWPSVGSIAERTCLSERAVRKAVGDLEKAQFISIHQRKGSSSYYTVTPARGAALLASGGVDNQLDDGAGTGDTPARGAPLHDAHPCTTRTPPRHEVPPPPARDAGDPCTSCTQNRKEPSEKRHGTTSGARGRFKPEDHVPPPLDRETWVEFCRFRRTDLKKPIKTIRSVTLIANDFERHGLTAEQARACVLDSIKNEYQGVFPAKFANWKPAKAPAESFSQTDYTAGVTADGRLS